MGDDALREGMGSSKALRKSKGKEKVKPEGPDAGQKKSPPHVSVAAIVGGMSPQKQRRILERGIDVLVATPGRLWDIMEDVSEARWRGFVFCLNRPLAQNDDLAKEVTKLKFLVLDEADRMIETGHFAELENILRLTLRGNKCVILKMTCHMK